jgi:hypothetical protein
MKRTPRALLSVLVPLALHALAREVDHAVGLLLHTSLDLPGFVPLALSLVEPAEAARRVAAWLAGGVGVWLALAAVHRSASNDGWSQALATEAERFPFLLLRPGLTVLALAALAVRPAYPYGFTLPVALTQDWGPMQDVAVLAAFLAWRVPRLRWPAPGAASLAFLAFLAYAFLAPPWAQRWEGHPGNEPKTLRMAVALGHWGTLDVEGVSAPMEELETRPLLRNLGVAAGTAARESGRLVEALLRGPSAVGRDAIQATRVTRQTVRGKEGGVYHVLAPGPSLLLAPWLRIDRALNRHLGTPGRVTVSLLAWNALAGLLVGAVFLLLRDATGSPRLSAALAAGAALAPPFVFYSFQFYPEMLGALVLTVAFRWLLFVERLSVRAAWGLGLGLATLPWLHQKFLPVWAVLALWAALRLVDELVPLRAFLGLLLPQAATLVLTALYNFAITGSVRPDALFLAWGPAGVSSSRIGQGLLGLWLDARYGIVPYVPFLLLAAGGLVLPAARRLKWAVPAAFVYYLTVAAADNWSGAVCNLGRYIMPVLPLVLAWAALALADAREGVWTMALALAGWTAILARLLWLDPHAANDCALLLARSVFADGNQYVPNLFLRAWSDAAPGLWARLMAWAAVAGVLTWWVRKAAAREAASAARSLLGGAALVLCLAFVLERWPGARTRPAWGDALQAVDGATVHVISGARVDDDAARVTGSQVELLVRTREPLPAVVVTFDGHGVVRAGGGTPVVLSGRRVAVPVPLEPLLALAGRRGVPESLARQRLFVEGSVVLRTGSP